jgi:beta-N-acetylhexosaminidase
VPKALIVGIPGTELDGAVRRLLADIDPLGFILFARNVETPDQVRRLVAELRDTVGRSDAPVLIDQEGGRVARLTPPHWRKAPPAAAFGRLAEQNLEGAKRAVHLNARLIGTELMALGINVDCAPVCDVPVADADPIIGDRAFAADPDRVAILARCFCEGLAAAGVLPIIKHIPGHGRAGVDSHKALPRVTAGADELAVREFAPFRALADLKAPVPWAMTAHVIYTAHDADAPATLSRRVIGDVIRGSIGFDGIIISDDLSMHALSGPFAARARDALATGCDIALHCNGKADEMTEVADGCGPIGAATAKRLEASLNVLETIPAFDAAEALTELTWLLAGDGAS